jgi:hypothetical protein
LIAGAGETANAIVLILACVVCELPVRFIRPFATKNPRRRKAMRFSSVIRSAECLIAAVRLLNLISEPGIKIRFRETLENFLERSQD